MKAVQEVLDSFNGVLQDANSLFTDAQGVLDGAKTGMAAFNAVAEANPLGLGA